MSGLHFQRRFSERRINAHFPYQVAFSAHAQGLVELMDNYCQTHFILFKRRRDGWGQLRYCFSSQRLADVFADEFGGDRINVATREEPDARRRQQ
jgi:hypothetical protein